MSIPVGLEELAERIGERRGGAFLVTVDTSGSAHVASVRPAWRDGLLAVPAGRTSRANVAARPRVTMLWPGEVDDKYALLVDGEAEATEAADGLSVRPVHAVLHRRV